jgi:hypothetical protein
VEEEAKRSVEYLKALLAAIHIIMFGGFPKFLTRAEFFSII